jgi:hypothetical protein
MKMEVSDFVIYLYTFKQPCNLIFGFTPWIPSKHWNDDFEKKKPIVCVTI